MIAKVLVIFFVCENSHSRNHFAWRKTFLKVF